MKIFPAIDLRGGRVVRLVQGDYDRETAYSGDPAAVARGFLDAGATCLHIVDLDGARDGAQANVAALRALAAIEGLYTEIGGGIRDERALENCLALGVGRVILGTVAVTDYGFVRDMIRKYGDRVAVGVDARGGFVAIDGWKTITEVKTLDLYLRLESDGLDTVIVTDISRDGALRGPNLPAYERLRDSLSLKIVASGGVTALGDVRALREIGVQGAIIGKALYTGAIDLKAAIREGEGRAC